MQSSAASNRGDLGALLVSGTIWRRTTRSASPISDFFQAPARGSRQGCRYARVAGHCRGSRTASSARWGSHPPLAAAGWRGRRRRRGSGGFDLRCVCERGRRNGADAVKKGRARPWILRGWSCPASTKNIPRRWWLRPSCCLLPIQTLSKLGFVPCHPILSHKPNKHDPFLIT